MCIVQLTQRANQQDEEVELGWGSDDEQQGLASPSAAPGASHKGDSSEGRAEAEAEEPAGKLGSSLKPGLCGRWELAAGFTCLSGVILPGSCPIQYLFGGQLH